MCLSHLLISFVGRIGWGWRAGGAEDSTMNIYIKVHHALVANEFVLILWHTGTWGDSLNCLSTGTWGVFLEVRFPLVAQGICWTHNTTLLHQIQKRMKLYHFQCHNDMWYVTIILQEFKKG